MAQFTAQGGGGVKTIFNGDGLYFRFHETKDHSFQFNKVVGGGGGGGGLLRFTGTNDPIRFHKRKQLRFRGATSSRVYNSSETKSSRLNNTPTPTPTRRSNLDEDENGEEIGRIYDEHDDDFFFDFETDDDLSSFRGLVLDVAYRPINVVCWKRAICLEFMEKADVLEYYDQTVSSPSASFNIPAVLRVPHLLQFVKRRRIKTTLSRKNILHRDSFTCQYCCSRDNLTIDHVLPIARGGEWKWENLVAACSRCNSRKGQKTLEEANMKLIKVPKVPKDYDILAIPLTTSAISLLKVRKGTPEEWHQYLSKPSPEP